MPCGVSSHKANVLLSLCSRNSGRVTSVKRAPVAWQSGVYYSLDEVGARIWALIEQPITITAIRDAILSEYEVQAEACERDVRAFIEGMDAAGLIEVLIGVKNEVGA